MDVDWNVRIPPKADISLMSAFDPLQTLAHVKRPTSAEPSSLGRRWSLKISLSRLARVLSNEPFPLEGRSFPLEAANCDPVLDWPTVDYLESAIVIAAAGIGGVPIDAMSRARSTACAICGWA